MPTIKGKLFYGLALENCLCLDEKGLNSHQITYKSKLNPQFTFAKNNNDEASIMVWAYSLTIVMVPYHNVNP